MPLPGDQHRDTPATINPFADTKPLISEYTASEIATLQSRLEKQLGPEYISTRPGAGGGKVHYLAAEKVINLANEVFGFNGWSSSIQNVQIDFVDEHPQNGKISLGLSTIVRVSLKDGTYHEDIGYGHIENCKGKAAAFEKAKKEAATDALKRALRNFGNVLGNCLYDKDYLSKITKVKCAPSRWDSGNLHRHPDFKPIKRESIAEAETANDNALATRRNESVQSGMSFGSAEFEDDFGAGGLEDVDFTGQTDEVGGVDDSTVTVTAPETPAQRAISGPQRQPLPRVASMPQLRPGNVQAPAPMQGMSAPQRPQGIQRPQGGAAQIPGSNNTSNAMMPPPVHQNQQHGQQQNQQHGQQSVQQNGQQQQQGQQNGQQQQGQHQHGQPPRQQNGGQQQQAQLQKPQAQQGANGLQQGSGGPNGMQRPPVQGQQQYQAQQRAQQQNQQQQHQPPAQAQQPNQPQHHQQPNGSGGNRSNPSSATTIADSPSNMSGNKPQPQHHQNQNQNQHTNPGAQQQQQQQQHTTNPLPPPPPAAPNQHPDLPLPRDPPPGAPEGFITARSTAGLQGMAKIAALENPVPFNPLAESPSIRRTHGVNPGKSAAVMRTAITVPPANGGGNGGIVTPGRQVRNFVEPAADTNRRIGAPGGMGMGGGLGGRGSGAFRAPTSVVGVKRPPLADVSNAQLNQMDGAGDAKKTKTESSDKAPPSGAGEGGGGGGTTAAPAGAP
ncbi:DNA repair protein rad52 [Elasticomyces elasticus]|nr:DNA repair protein rad52 [Elasticomyces elasticus]